MKAIGLRRMVGERRVAMLAATAALGIVLCAISFIQPASLPLAPCFFHSLTGHSCLTCGMTRSLHAVAHGHWAASFRYHLFGPLIFGGMILGLLGLGVEAICGIKVRPRFVWERWKPFLIAVVVVWLAYGLIRFIAEGYLP